MKRSAINILAIIIVSFLAQACMMPFGMNWMHGENNQAEKEFKTTLSAVNGDYSQTIFILISEANGNSKFYIKTENLQTGNYLTDYNAELNIYRVSSAGATMDEFLRNPVSLHNQFSNLNGDEKYFNYALLNPGEYLLNVKVNEVEGKTLPIMTEFNYKFSREVVWEEQSSDLSNVNYWLIGAAMAAFMAVMMSTGF